MHCIVTAGPTFEPLDSVRRLTNFSTGSLGAQLAAFLSARGHDVTLLASEMATYCGEWKAGTIRHFTTTQNLRDLLAAAAQKPTGAVFHAAAVSDFTFGKLWRRAEQGDLTEVAGGKISTRGGNLFAELRPTPKIISELRAWYPKSTLVGWKYEVDGNRSNVVERAQRQLAESRTDCCVANGPAYGDGFGLVKSTGELTHLARREDLFEALIGLVA